MLHGVAELRTAATDAHSDSQQLIRAMSSGLEQVCRARARTSPFLSVMCPLQSTQALADAISLVLTRAERDQMEALSRVCTLYGRHVRGAL